MTTRLTALIATCLGVLVLGTAPSMANDVAAGATASTATYESGFQPTQGRGLRRGGGRAVVIAPRRRNNTGRNVAIGAGALIIGGIIASEAARSRSSGGNSCGRWDYQCRRGVYSSCRNFDRYC